DFRYGYAEGRSEALDEPLYFSAEILAQGRIALQEVRGQVAGNRGCLADLVIDELFFVREGENRFRGQVVHEVSRHGRLVRVDRGRTDLDYAARARDLHVLQLQLVGNGRRPGDENRRGLAQHRGARAVPDCQLTLVRDDGVGLELRDDDLHGIHGRLRLLHPDRAPDEATQDERKDRNDDIFHGRFPKSPNLCCRMVSAAMAAVSVRSTRGPMRTAVKLERRATSCSLSVSPPSGPINTVTPAALTLTSSIDTSLIGESSSRVIRGSTPLPRNSKRSVGCVISGTLLRPHCSQAATAIARQCWSFLSACFASRRTTLRSVKTGTMREPPSSVAFCRIQSMRSPREIPCASVSGRGDSRFAACSGPTSTRTVSRRNSRIVAAYSAPFPLNSVRGSPARSRSTRVM